MIHSPFLGTDSALAPALAYHRFPSPGKFSTVPSKPLADARDLALAYSPGVAEACLAIHENPAVADLYTIKRSLVAVISNGTAVLGLGDIGPLAAKPVMEGKAVLFQHFAKLNAIDLVINETDPDKLVDIIAALAPSFGGINLEDIKAPDCFVIEQRLKERLDIPVFHDDQHGTAITVAAALTNALMLVGKTIEQAKCVVSGAGASALACLQLLTEMGMKKEHIFVCDTKGLIHQGRSDLNAYKAQFAQKATDQDQLHQVVQGADILLGLSRPGAFTPAMIAAMAPRPIVFALANPVPEIWPQQVYDVTPDALVGTGRSDVPNQVNNVLCFPYIFRGALDVGAGSITTKMKKACAQALANLARQPMHNDVNSEQDVFGPHYFLPKPFDPRLIVELPLAVAQAAIEEGLAPGSVCLHAYRRHLETLTLYALSTPESGTKHSSNLPRA